MDIAELIRLRHELHRHPELSGNERWTSERIADVLRQAYPDHIIESLGGFGIAAVFEAEQDVPDKTILFRAELDALPISEETGLPHQSQVKGVMHACGHDGHMAILAGLAYRIRKIPVRKKKIILLFQPSEETGDGAGKIMDDNRFHDLGIDHAYALHNLPHYNENTVYIRYNTFAFASAGVEVIFTGRSSHAAYPEQGISPGLAIAEFLQTIHERLSAQFENNRSGKFAITFIRMGEPAFGVSPGKAVAGITLRAVTDEKLSEALKWVESVIAESNNQFDGTISFSVREPFSAVVNNKEGVKVVSRAAKQLNLPVKELDEPFPWSEDFGVFGATCPVTFFGIGAGTNSAPLHSEKYDFNDSLIESGIQMFEKIIELE